MPYSQTVQPIKKFKKHLIPVPPQKLNLEQNQKYCLEIGAGTGMHAISFCKKHPDEKLIAIEKTSEKYRKFKKQHELENLPNLIALQSNAIHWVCHNLWKESLKKIFILYPNPEPKNPAQRWPLMPFTEYLLDCLVPEGELYFASNIKGYIKEAELQYSGFWNLSLEKKNILKEANLARSLFEKKYIERGEVCIELCFKKGANSPTPFKVN